MSFRTTGLPSTSSVTTRFFAPFLMGRFRYRFSTLNSRSAFGEQPRRLAVGLHDVIDVEVAPPAGGVVHDLDDGRLPGELGHVPRVRGERLAAAGLVVRPGGGADHLAVDEQVQGELLRILPAADEEA